MNTPRTPLAAAVGRTAVSGAASARDFTQMGTSGWYNGQLQPQNAGMNNMQEQIIRQNMANPQIAAMYKQIVAGGQSHGDLRVRLHLSRHRRVPEHAPLLRDVRPDREQ